MNWYKIAKERKDELLFELQQLIQINSVLDENSITENKPFGKGPYEALNYMLQKGKEKGFVVKNIDNYAGHIEIGQGNEILGILCHVDVVPAGDDWTYPPFEGKIVDGKIYGRGALDDKGPTIAAWLAMKMVADMNIPLKKRVRLIIGTDEETGFRCVNRYFQKEEMPTIGFSPDGDFPVINAEKGIAHLLFTQKGQMDINEQLVSFEAGNKLNKVPDCATAILQNMDETFVKSFEQFQSMYEYPATLIRDGNYFIVQVKGKSVHAMEPEKGINASIVLGKFLLNYVTTKGSYQFLKFLVHRFGDEVKGENLQIQYEDTMSGPTTFNVGIVSFDNKKGATIEVSMRYSVTYPFEENMTKLMQNISNDCFTLDIVSNSKPHYVSEQDELVKKLLKVYRKVTGDNRKPLSTGGGTYARIMEKGVAFGMLFPNEEDVSHQKDEHVSIENLITASAIYAEAIVELASKTN